MTFSTRKSAYWSGFFDGLPFLIVAAPFAMLFGVLATEAGFSLSDVMGFSVVVVAGASQFTAVQLMTENAPVWVVLAGLLASAITGLVAGYGPARRAAFLDPVEALRHE